MIRRSGTPTPALLVATFAALTGGVLAVTSPLLANGGKLRVGDAAIGRYRVSVYTDPTPPRPDSLDVSVLVLRDGGAEPVDGLDVRVEARFEGSAPEGVRAPLPVRTAATRDQADDPRYYAAKFAPGVEGPWAVEVAVAGPEGSGSVTFDLRVREPGLLERGWVVLVLALMPLALLGWWLGRPSGARPARQAE